MTIRPAFPSDFDAIWAILEPTIRLGEVFCLPRTMERDEALAYWFSTQHQVFVAEMKEGVVGTYYIRPNQLGGGSHVANCGYATVPWAMGKGIARTMGLHSLEFAKEQGFRAMQFNIVISTNTRAVNLWQSLGFEVVGSLPDAFLHPVLGFVDAYVMYRAI